jgi:hypothetical protein
MAREELGKDASNGPDINRGRVIARAEQNLWSAVPKCDDLKEKPLCEILAPDLRNRDMAKHESKLSC